MNNNTKKNNSYNDKILSPNEAFMYGTAFRSLVDPYKNFKPINPVPSTEQERLQNEIQKHMIVVHDLSLYLDVYPNDEEAVMLRKQYSMALEKVKDEYNKKYPPFCKTAIELNVTPFPWSTTKFPWGEQNV